MPLYITEAEVARLVTMDDALASLEACFGAWSEKATINLPRQRAVLPGAAFNLMGATYGRAGVYGMKAYLGGRGYHVMLYSTETAELLAVIEANLASQLRTGAASGLATKVLANPHAATLAVIGSGKQARAQVLAVCAVRAIREVRVFSPAAEHREDFARRMEAELAISVRPTPSGAACVEGADVVVAITKAADPVMRAEWLTPGAHVNGAGANSAARREIDAETVLRATVRATDDRAQAQIEGAEFRDLVGAGKLAWSDVSELGDLLAGTAPGRRAASDITLFKSLGIALEDIAFGKVIYEKARAAGMGNSL
jgi:ornithine cyclodeaminase/alanine dehydrogenase